MKKFIIGFCIECIYLYQFVQDKIRERNKIRQERRLKSYLDELKK